MGDNAEFELQIDDSGADAVESAHQNDPPINLFDIDMKYQSIDVTSEEESHANNLQTEGAVSLCLDGNLHQGRDSKLSVPSIEIIGPSDNECDTSNSSGESESQVRQESGDCTSLQESKISSVVDSVPSVGDRTDIASEQVTDTATVPQNEKHTEQVSILIICNLYLCPSPFEEGRTYCLAYVSWSPTTWHATYNKGEHLAP